MVGAAVGNRHTITHTMCSCLRLYISASGNPSEIVVDDGIQFFVVLFATIVGRKTLLVNAAGRRAVIALGSGTLGFILSSLLGMRYNLDGNVVMMMDQIIVAITFMCVSCYSNSGIYRSI